MRNSENNSCPPSALLHRPRRLRRNETMRRMVRENHLRPEDMILPIFVDEQITEKTAISSMPGVFRHPESQFTSLIKDAKNHGIPAIMLFGVSYHKDHTGSDSMRYGGLLDRMIKRAKDAAPDMLIIADACFCEYTDHGHCGPLDHNHDVDNDKTIENIAKQSVIAAQAGADIIAPSGMMDGQIAAIRSGLDENGFSNIAIMAYAAKYASAFYGPFRDAAGCALGKSTTAKSDRKTYQMDPANSREALREVALDIEQGADMVMVKPGLAYLDIVKQVKDTFDMPTFAYQVSGEYAMIKAAAEKGWLDEKAVMMETLLAFKRAGADGIITYFAIEAAKTIREQL